MPEESDTITVARPAGDAFAFPADAENELLVWIIRTAAVGGPVRVPDADH